jgi:ABC-type multidrug transport system ATPase subunit
MNRTLGRQLGSVDALALSFSNVTRRFGSTVALDDVSFDVRRGGIRVLVGLNGSGKSTPMKPLSDSRHTGVRRVDRDLTGVLWRRIADRRRLGAVGGA